MCYSFCMIDWKEFARFIAPDCPRCDFIVSYLEKRGVHAVVLPIEDKKHIYVVFPKECYNPAFTIKTVVAHYDRFEGSPGANDNSSSVFALMDWAVRLQRSGRAHNVRLIFTDGEEMCGSSGAAGGKGEAVAIGATVASGAPAASSGAATVSAQGAFGLASVFRRLGITDDDVFVFDCVGRGTIPVLGRSTLGKGISTRFKKRFAALQARTEQVLRAASGGVFVNLPVSYSDNAGFLACGIPAVAVTLLPADEAHKYMFDLVQVPVLEAFVMNRPVPDCFDRAKLAAMLPETWRRFHTVNDDIASLTEESFALMERILHGLADLRTYSA